MTWKIGAIVEPSTNTLLIVLPADKGQNLRAYFLYKLGICLGQHYQPSEIVFNFRNKVTHYITARNLPDQWREEIGIAIVPSHNNVKIVTSNYRNPSNSHVMGWLQQTARDITAFIVERMPPLASETTEEQPVPEEPVVEEPSVPVVPEGVSDTHWETEPELPEEVWVNDAIVEE